MTALEAKHVSKHFDGLKAVDRLSIGFPKGKITSIIGPNGSGKSTLINLLTGLIPFDTGVAVLSNVTLRRIVPHENPGYGITRTFQDVRLFEQMPVLDNVLVVTTDKSVLSSIFERHGAYHLAKAEEVLRRVGLWEKRHIMASELSYGQRKLLEIARVLAMDAAIIFFDEPFAGLFPEMLTRIAEIMKELRGCGKTQILVEHNMELIRELSDHLVVMDEGRLLAEGLPSDVLARREVMEAYLGE